jgi:hypothetical protein
MFCKQCGTKNDSDAKFCIKCGLSFVGGEPKSEKKEEAKNGGEAGKKKKMIIAGIIAAIILVFVFVYLNRTGQTNKEVLLAKVETRKGHIQTPAYIKPETLTVIGLGKLSKVDEKGDFSTSAYAEGVTNVVAMFPGKEFGMMDIVIGNETPELTLQSTAEALVFMAPHLVSSDPKLSEEILTLIRKDKNVANLAKELDRVLKENGNPLEDQAFLKTYGKAINSVLDTLNQ